MLIFDCETSPLPDAADYIEVGDPPSNYKNPDAIAKWRDEEQAKQLAKAAVDVDLCRVVAIASSFDVKVGVHAMMCDTTESEMLEMFWREVSAGDTLIGFNCLFFDLPVLYRRSLYLGVKPPDLERGKYKHRDVIDLLDILTEQGRLRPRSLDFYCRRFGIDIPAVGTGADVPGWVAAGDWTSVEAHVRADVQRTAALAQRMGVV